MVPGVSALPDKMTLATPLIGDNLCLVVSNIHFECTGEWQLGISIELNTITVWRGVAWRELS